MKKAMTVIAIVLSLGMTLAFDAEAKRLGGGRSSGMQRQSAPAPAPAAPHTTPGTPAQQGAPAVSPGTTGAAAGTAAAAAPKRSWMGPIAGLAAGLGLAALASHFGFGGALANMMLIGLLVLAVLMVIGFVMRRRATGRDPVAAGAGNPSGGTGLFQRDQAEPVPFRTLDGAQPQGGSVIGSRLGGGMGSVQAPIEQGAALPVGFDAAGFANTAKMQFMALQAANDARDLDRLRDFLTPEMFEVARADIVERGDAPQATEVFGLEAQVLSVAEEQSLYVASVRFTGRLRDQPGAVPEDLDEVWHLTKPRSGFGGWVIAGIQQRG